MKKIFLVFSAVVISLASCNQNNSNKESDIVVQSSDNIIQGVETNSKGDILEYIFNNTENTATFIFNGEKIEMTVDNTKASGANYRNDSYSYTNWHGISELKKDGELIFSHQQ